MDAAVQKKLWEYFEVRQEPLEHAYHVIREWIDEQEKEWLEQGDKLPEPERSKWWKVNLRIFSALLYGHVIAACSLLEDTMREICKEVDPTYSKEKIEGKYKGRGNWLEKHFCYLNTTSLPPNAKAIRYKNELGHAITLRNCIGHTWGNIDEHRYDEQVRDTIDYYTNNPQKGVYVEESSDGYLLIGGSLIPEINVNSDKLVRELLGI